MPILNPEILAAFGKCKRALGNGKSRSEFEYDISIRSDQLEHNHRNRVWFYFSVSGAKKGQKICLNIINFTKRKSLYRLNDISLTLVFRQGATPVVSSREKPDWVRLPSRNVFYYQSPRHYKKYILSILFEFDSDQDTYYFAYR